jgi:excisionase family DNA binding protein
MTLLTMTEAIAKLKIAKPTLYGYVSRGKIPYLKIGARVLFDDEELDLWLESCRVPTSAK